MPDETYFELIPLDITGYEEEAVDADDEFDELVFEALDRREQGEFDQFSIVRTVREGDEAEHREVAYVAANDPDRVGFIVLRIADPTHLPLKWHPDTGQGMTFTMPPFVPGGPTRHQRVVPMWDPSALPGHNELMHRIEHLPYYADTSWKNDVSPSVRFAVGGKPYKMFIAPGRIAARRDEQERRYSLFEIDRADGQSIDEAIEEDDVIWNPVEYTDDPKVILRFIEDNDRLDDPSAERFRLLDLENKRRSARKGRDLPEFDDADQRFALLDLGDDPRMNPSRRRRARRNPDEVAEAKEKYEEFHRHKPKKIWEGPSIIPKKVRELGKAKAVLYRSDKNDPDTGRPVKRPINYIHDHDAGVKAYTPASSGGVEVPKFIRDAEALVVLGKCLGFDFEDGGKVREAKGIKPYPDLCATPCGKALLVIQDRREVIAIIWGGALGVEARGIVG